MSENTCLSLYVGSVMRWQLVHGEAASRLKAAGMSPREQQLKDGSMDFSYYTIISAQ